jgi:cation:H+ antiporter
MVVAGILLVAGVALAALGGELFVRGLVSAALWWRVPAGIVGATVAAFATSAPELSVAINAASDGRPGIALGDALGSNIINIGVVLGLALAFAPIGVNRGTLVRDIPAALVAPLVLGLLAWDGTLGRIDAVVLIVIFVGWLTQTAFAARRVRDATVSVLGEHSRTAIVTGLVGGVLMLIAAGRLIVSAAETIGSSLGWDMFVVGAVVVALGTSTPEIATMLAARRRRHDEVGVGTVLGSNIFNTLLIVGVAALITPIEIETTEVSIGLAGSVIAAVLVIPGRSGRLARWRSIPLLGTYVITLLLILS